MVHFGSAGRASSSARPKTANLFRGIDSETKSNILGCREMKSNGGDQTDEVEPTIDPSLYKALCLEMQDSENR